MQAAQSKQPKQQFWSPIRFKMALPPDVGSALYDVIWEKPKGEQSRATYVSNR